MNAGEVREKIEKFYGVKLISLSHNINAHGQTSGTIRIAMFDGCNLPKSILDMAIAINQTSDITPINTMGNLAVETFTSNTTYEATFNYDRRFIYTLKFAHEKEEWRRANDEMDKFIEEWLANE